MKSINRMTLSGKNVTSRINDGFTLVELLIVLVIIAIVASIAAMSSLAARVQANEGQAKAALKAILSASEMYRNTVGVYPDSMTTLGSDYIGPDLVAGQKSGYTFTFKSANQGATFTCTAAPVSMNYTGVKSYCINVLNSVQVYANTPNLSADGNTCPSGGSALSG